MSRYITQSISNDHIVQTIDQLLQHHYFQTRLDQILFTKKNYYDSKTSNGLLDDQYYKAQDQVVADIVDIVQQTTQEQLRNVLQREFIDIGQEIQGMKQQIYLFMDQQNKKIEEVKKQVAKLSQQIKRKISTSQAMSSTAVVSSNGYTGGIRFIRSSAASSSSQNTNPPTNVNLNASTQTKSIHSELSSIKKQLQQLKQSIQKSQNIKIVQQQLNQFKIETKVSLESLKQQSKKLSLQIATIAKSSTSPQITPVIKQHIQSTIKRTITAQLKVYAAYSDQITQIKHQIQEYQQKLQKQSQLHNQYLSNQLKSVWLIINDMKKNLDQVLDLVGLNSSRDML